MALLQEERDTAATGYGPTPEPLSAEHAALPLAVGADGVMAPFRPEAGTPRGKSRWREIKVGVLARLGQHRTRTGQGVPRLVQRRLVAVLGDLEALSPRLWSAAVRQGMRQAPQVVWLSDGGRGLWRLFEARFAGHAQGILDFYHAVQQLWKGAAAWLDGRTTHARRWFGWARHRLRHGLPDGVLADLEDALDVEGLPATARDTLTTVHAYLERHREHMNYAQYKELACHEGLEWSKARANGSSSSASKGWACGGVRTVSTISYISGSPGSMDALRHCSPWTCPRTEKCAR
jgi:hypothetical protein